MKYKINICIRFYEELNAFIKNGPCKKDRFIKIEKNTDVGTLINSTGVPCSSVDMILVNGHSVNFDYVLANNDRISVYPVFERFNIESVTCLENSPLRNLKFICDIHLGRLAMFLRMLGFDTLYNNDYDKYILIRYSNKYQRIILSRNQRLLQNKKISRRFMVKQSEPLAQIREVLQYFDLKNEIAPMSRCLKCNASVQAVLKENVKHRVDKNIFKLNNEFSECKGCGRLFWKGSHYDSMMTQIGEMINY